MILILIFFAIPVIIILLGAVKFWLFDVLFASVKEAIRTTPPRP